MDSPTVYLPAFDRYDLAIILVSAVVILVGVLVDPLRIPALLTVFVFYLAWMAYVLQKWMFETSAED